MPKLGNAKLGDRVLIASRVYPYQYEATVLGVDHISGSYVLLGAKKSEAGKVACYPSSFHAPRDVAEHFRAVSPDIDQYDMSHYAFIETTCEILNTDKKEEAMGGSGTISCYAGPVGSGASGPNTTYGGATGCYQPVEQKKTGISDEELEQLKKLVKSTTGKQDRLLAALATKTADPRILDILADTRGSNVHLAVATNSYTSLSTLERLLQSEYGEASNAALARSKITQELLLKTLLPEPTNRDEPIEDLGKKAVLSHRAEVIERAEKELMAQESHLYLPVWKAKFIQVSDPKNNEWQVYNEKDECVLIKTVDEITGGREELYDGIGTEKFGKALIARTKKDGVGAVDWLYSKPSPSRPSFPPQEVDTEAKGESHLLSSVLGMAGAALFSGVMNAANKMPDVRVADADTIVIDSLGSLAEQQATV